MDKFMSIMNADHPEVAAQRLIAAASDGGKGNYGLLETARKALRPEEFNDFSSLVLREMGQPKPGARGITQEIQFSPASFLTRWNAMDDKSKGLLFGGQFAKSVDNLVRVVKRIEAVESQANTSRSGTTLATLGGAGTIASSIAHGDWLTPLGIVGGGTALSIILSRPAYAKWATKYAELRAKALASPATASIGLANHIATLADMAKHDPSLIPVYTAVASEMGTIANPDKNRARGGSVTASMVYPSGAIDNAIATASRYN